MSVEVAKRWNQGKEMKGIMTEDNKTGMCQGLTFTWFRELEWGRSLGDWCSDKKTKQAANALSTEFRHGKERQSWAKDKLKLNEGPYSTVSRSDNGNDWAKTLGAALDGQLSSKTQWIFRTLDLHCSGQVTNTHCTGLARKDEKVRFFDPNYGEVVADSLAELKQWFGASNYLKDNILKDRTVPYNTVNWSKITVADYSEN